MKNQLTLIIASAALALIGAAIPAKVYANQDYSHYQETATFGKSASGALQTTRNIQLAQTNICPEDNPSQFIHAETKNYNVYICGGDLPHLYVGIAKKNGSKIMLPLQNSQSSREFTAVNFDHDNHYTYILNQKLLTVLRNGNPIVVEAARWL
jgi:hypothetical protein